MGTEAQQALDRHPRPTHRGGANQRNQTGIRWAQAQALENRARGKQFARRAQPDNSPDKWVDGSKVEHDSRIAREGYGGMGLNEFLDRKAKGTLPPPPELPDVESLH